MDSGVFLLAMSHEVRLDFAHVRDTSLGIFAVEQLGDFFECGPTGFGLELQLVPVASRLGCDKGQAYEEEVDNDELDSYPATVDGIELPFRVQMAEADGVDVPVELD